MALLCAKSSKQQHVNIDNNDTLIISDSFKLILSKLKSSTDESITNSELNVLFAVCDNAIQFKSEIYVDLLFPLLSKYLIFSSNKSFKSLTLFKLENDITPWTKLTYQITKALIHLTINFPKFNQLLYITFNDYISNLKLSNNLYHQFSLIGFINALTDTPSIINEDIFNLIVSVCNNNFFNSIDNI